MEANLSPALWLSQAVIMDAIFDSSLGKSMLYGGIEMSSNVALGSLWLLNGWVILEYALPI
jgi:hypothetical protein